MNEALIDLLRADLEAAEYRHESVVAVLGAEADAARFRGVFSPARLALADRQDACAHLIRLFLFGATLDAAELDAALPSLGAQGAYELGLLEASADGGLRAAVSLNAVELEGNEWWVLSDLDDHLRLGPARPDHVMGVGGATRSLIAQLPHLSDGTALDLGTGCGIVALHLVREGPVVATDISERALMFARANARLNGVDALGIEFRQGDLFDPVASEEFSLIASNPPFVITPRGDSDEMTYEYRDGGMVGDALAERVVREAPAHLAEGGTLVCLANWESPWGTNGLARAQSWVQSAAAARGPLAAWVIERQRLSPLEYAEIWARDGGAHPGTHAYTQLVDRWLQDFHTRRITAIGLGSIRMHRPIEPGLSTAPVRAEQVAGAFTTSPGPVLERVMQHAVWVSGLADEAVLGLRWLRAPDLVDVREHRPGQEAPFALWLRTEQPIGRVITCDPLLAAAVGVCDGELTLGQIADALATLLEVDPAAAAEALVSGARELVWLGMLEPAYE